MNTVKSLTPGNVSSKIQTTTEQGGRYIDCSVKNLTTFPMEIIQLNPRGHFKQLNMEGNKIQQLPKEIGRLNDLVELNLEGNCLTTLPPELSYCTDLRWIDLDSNGRMNAQDGELWQAYKMSERPTKPFPLDMVCCKGGRKADNVMRLLAHRMAIKKQTSTEFINTGEFRQDGKLEKDRTMQAAGAKNDNRRLDLFGDDWASAPVDQMRNKRVTAFNNKISHGEGFKLGQEWASENYQSRPVKRQAAHNKREQVNVTKLHSGPNPQEKGGLRIKGGGAGVGDESAAGGVIGRNWGEGAGEYHLANAKQMMKQVEGRPQDMMGAFGAHKRGDTPPRNKLRMVGTKNLGDPNSRLNINAEWGTAPPRDEVYGHKGLGIRGEPQGGSVIFAEGGAYRDPNPNRINQNRVKRQVQEAPRNKFGSFDTQGELKVEKLKRVIPKDRLTTTSAHFSVLNHGEEQQQNFQSRNPAFAQYNNGPQPGPSNSNKPSVEAIIPYAGLKPTTDCVTSILTRLDTGTHFDKFTCMNTLRMILAFPMDASKRQLMQRYSSKILASLDDIARSSLAQANVITSLMAIAEFFDKFNNLNWQPQLLETVINRLVSGESKIYDESFKALVNISKKTTVVTIIPRFRNLCNTGLGARATGWCIYGLRESLLNLKKADALFDGTPSRPKLLEDCLYCTMPILVNNEQPEILKLAHDCVLTLARQCATISMANVDALYKRLQEGEWRNSQGDVGARMVEAIRRDFSESQMS